MSLAVADWFSLGLHFAGLSLLAVGGGFSVAPGMHRYLVDQQAWLTPAQFSAAIALAQAAPGPNVLFVSLLGWQVGWNAGGGVVGAVGAALVCLLGMVLPSSMLTLWATRWAHRHQHHRGVRAFKQGMTPLVVALLAATAYLMLRPLLPEEGTWRAVALCGLAFLVLWRTRVHLLWVLLAGAVAGALGIV
jgi:chromate transporter